MKKYNLLFVFVGLLVFTALAGVSCSRGPDPEDDTTLVVDDNGDNGDADAGDDVTTPPDEDLDIVPPSTGLENPAGLRSLVINEKMQADEAIQTLQQDVKLKLVSIKYINSLSNQTGLANNYYIYSSISNPSFYYMVSAPRNGEKFKRFLMPIEDLDLPFELMPIPIQFWKLTYADALAEAEKRGGATFRARHATFEASIILAMPTGQHLSWFITYRATDGTAEMLKVSVNANTGEVVLI